MVKCRQGLVGGREEKLTCEKFLLKKSLKGCVVYWNKMSSNNRPREIGLYLPRFDALDKVIDTELLQDLQCAAQRMWGERIEEEEREMEFGAPRNPLNPICGSKFYSEAGRNFLL
ncbi:hypothetical protein NPIL_191301 [Nephila pilipes]|uniref:Uncharacterized protein n=1 Tax=Nephila pilipes TaxID=299642 RepID=A0A8X6NGG4_NEPPI|nr:hypothetical protein NPIL_191301 [Nephila pilipes]